MDKTKLIVVNNFAAYTKGVNEDGPYLLVYPKYYVDTGRVLFGHVCSTTKWAMHDLQNVNRTEFLNELFGKDGWELEFYQLSNLADAYDTFRKYYEEDTTDGVDTFTVERLLERYKINGKAL